jgi:hypothetical protein
MSAHNSLYIEASLTPRFLYINTSVSAPNTIEASLSAPNSVYIDASLPATY